MAVIEKAGVPSLSTLTPDHSCQVGSGLIAGEAIEAGDACYIDSTGTVKLATTATGAHGIAARDSAAGEAVTLFVNVEFHYGSGLTPGAIAYLSDTEDGALEDAGDVAVAYAVDATRIRFVGGFAPASDE